MLENTRESTECETVENCGSIDKSHDETGGLEHTYGKINSLLLVICLMSRRRSKSNLEDMLRTDFWQREEAEHTL